MDCLYRSAARVALDAPRSWQLGNAAINRLLHTPQGFTLVGWSDVQHLDGPVPDEAADVDGKETTPRFARDLVFSGVGVLVGEVQPPRAQRTPRSPRKGRKDKVKPLAHRLFLAFLGTLATLAVKRCLRSDAASKRVADPAQRCGMSFAP